MGLFNTSGLECRKEFEKFFSKVRRERESLLTLGADFRAAFVANCLRGALPPVDFRAVCFVRAIR